MMWEVMNYGSIRPGDEAFVRVGKSQRRQRVTVERFWLTPNSREIQAWTKFKSTCSSMPASKLEPIR